MFLSEISIKNFRCFDDNEHKINFNPGLTVLVGENDSGKSAIIDAIRIVLGTTDFTWHRIENSDFYNEDRSREIHISCEFEDLTEYETGAFLEYLTYDDSKKSMLPKLYLHWRCKCNTAYVPARYISSTSTGKDGDGPTLSAEARELLRVTYLRALRDAYSEMQSGRKSRLSQIIQNIPRLNEGKNLLTDGVDLKELSLVGIVNLSNDLLENHPAIQSINDKLTSTLEKQFLLKADSLTTKLEVAGGALKDSQKMTSLLEKLDLTVNKTSSTMQGKVGLGTSNILSMACELLLNDDDMTPAKSSFLLIEEPEAHIHAQRQLKLIQSLELDSEKRGRQIIITTHSPLLASVVRLENITLMKDGQAFSMSKGLTLLGVDDYTFLEKYLDATKANLFFAKSVLIVEGPGEALLLHTIAKLMGFSFIDYGVSLVDVRGVGLRRYAKIFQRAKEGEILNVKVACVTDRDIMPMCAPAICLEEEYCDSEKWPDINSRKWRVEEDFTEEEMTEYISNIKKRADGQNVKTFVSDYWTLEYDLAFVGFGNKEMKKVLICALAKTLQGDNYKKVFEKINDTIDEKDTFEEQASKFYKYFTRNNVSKACFAQQLAHELESNIDSLPNLESLLPKYIVGAIKYVTSEEHNEF